MCLESELQQGCLQELSSVERQLKQEQFEAERDSPFLLAQPSLSTSLRQSQLASLGVTFPLEKIQEAGNRQTLDNNFSQILSSGLISSWIAPIDSDCLHIILYSTL